jgi:GAF domain-containing protein
LVLPRGVEQWLAAEATTSGDTIIVRLREASVTEAAVPESIVHYVVRTHESVMLDDASAQNPFSTDSYIRRHHARSILCLPLINQAKLIGVLYLENNLTPYVFTPTRIAVYEQELLNAIDAGLARRWDSEWKEPTRLCNWRRIVDPGKPE